MLFRAEHQMRRWKEKPVQRSGLVFANAFLVVWCAKEDQGPGD
jgi:hypothetical protein